MFQVYNTKGILVSVLNRAQYRIYKNKLKGTLVGDAYHKGVLNMNDDSLVCELPALTRVNVESWIGNAN